MKYHRISVSLITSASVAAIWAVPGTLKTAHAQLSTGKPPAESIPPHGYVIASKPLKGTDTPADYALVDLPQTARAREPVERLIGSGAHPRVVRLCAKLDEREQPPERAAPLRVRMNPVVA